MMKQKIIWALILFMGTSVFAESRLWKDTDGNEYQAEYVRELFDKVTLKTDDGKEVRLPVEDLSEHDQKYLRVMVPPNMEIDFSKSTYIKAKPQEMGDLDKDTVTVFSSQLTITKDSNRPFTSRLEAELFLIGEEVVMDEYKILLSKTDSSFLLPQEKGESHVFKTAPIELQVYTEYDNSRRGPVFIGYLVVIKDWQGNTVKVQTDIPWLEDKVDELRTLYERGFASVYSRYFDKETVQKMKVPMCTGSFSRN